MIKNTDIRFFTWCNNENEPSGLECVEITENQFLKLTVGCLNSNPIYYERNAVFNNGCKQVCLTVDPLDLVDFYELERA
jgi:hypothetical protein